MEIMSCERLNYYEVQQTNNKAANNTDELLLRMTHGVLYQAQNCSLMNIYCSVMIQLTAIAAIG
jgi:hypothetical protein